MPYAFLRSIHENGRVRVPLAFDSSETSLAKLDAALRDADLTARAELSGHAPEFVLLPARWAAVTLFHACQFFVYREIGADDVRNTLARPCPSAVSPAVCYSADLSFRYLADLISLARGIAPDDPLVSGLMSLARDWPLSSVGVKGIDDSHPLEFAERVRAFIQDSSLRTLYADRIIERRDSTRLGTPCVMEAVREALGLHVELCPDFAKQSIQPESSTAEVQ